ncbi:hypothetical protein ACKZDW_02480 (plasmid) [Ralstonia syzygii subsp. celebesensis]
MTSAGSANIKPNTSYSAILPTASVATITGGGDPSDTQLIGYTKATQYFLGAGSSYTFNALPVSGNVSDLKLTRKISDGTVAVLTYTSGTPTGTQWAGTASGGTVAITLGTALASGEYIRAEDPYAAIATTGQAPSYGSIHGGYDDSIQSGLMNHIVSSAHSHIDDQDGTPGHVMIFGGSANYITGNIAYSSILAGTGNEIRSGAANGSVILGVSTPRSPAPQPPPSLASVARSHPSTAWPKARAKPSAGQHQARWGAAIRSRAPTRSPPARTASSRQTTAQATATPTR